MKPSDLIGRVFRVIEADDYRLLLETDDGSGLSTNKFVLVEPKSIEGSVEHGLFEISNLVRK